MRIISLGWGVQSFTLAAMVALGELEPVDAVVHADTGHERSGTYKFAEEWTPWLQEHGVNVITVYNELTAPVDEWGGVYVPAFTSTSRTKGQLRRQCTHRWKVVPMRRWLQLNRIGERVDQLLGISLDEAHRARQSEVKYITNNYPLIERKMTRGACKAWLLSNGLEIPVKSSCTFCPYHNMAAWRDVNRSSDDWDEAVAFDRAIRGKRPPHDVFIHPARIPLEDVDLRTLQEKGQLELDWDDELYESCPEGVCGV